MVADVGRMSMREEGARSEKFVPAGGEEAEDAAVAEELKLLGDCRSTPGSSHFVKREENMVSPHYAAAIFPDRIFSWTEDRFITPPCPMQPRGEGSIW
jgi:hypothetical protein